MASELNNTAVCLFVLWKHCLSNCIGWIAVCVVMCDMQQGRHRHRHRQSEWGTGEQKASTDTQVHTLLKRDWTDCTALSTIWPHLTSSFLCSLIFASYSVEKYPVRFPKCTLELSTANWLLSGGLAKGRDLYKVIHSPSHCCKGQSAVKWLGQTQVRHYVKWTSTEGYVNFIFFFFLNQWRFKRKYGS